MGRLTNETLDNAISVYKTVVEAFENNSINDEDYNPMLDKCTLSFLEELKDYRQKEEQGLLLKLPCKVGDELFVLDDRKTIHPFILEDIEINQCGLYILIAYNGNKEYLQFWKIRTPIENIHKTVFLTKEEAEKALAEMEKKDE